MSEFREKKVTEKMSLFVTESINDCFGRDSPLCLKKLPTTFSHSRSKPIDYSSIESLFFRPSQISKNKNMISELKYPQLKLAYDKTNCEVEEMSERIFFVMVKVAPQTLTLPKLINSFIAYFFTHLDSDAFDLPLPMW